jgi:hypothetical protein
MVDPMMIESAFCRGLLMTIYLKVFAVAGVYALGAWTAVRLRRRISVDGLPDSHSGSVLFV